MAELNIISLLTLFGATIIVGYVGHQIFQKSKIPDIIWLMLFGLLIGPIFGVIDISVFSDNLIGFLSSLALLIILFDAGLHLNIYNVIRDAPRGMVLAVSGLIVSMILVGLVAVLVLRIDFALGLLLGAILGGTSAPIVLSLVRESETAGRVRNVLSIESALTDALTIIVALFLLNITLPAPGIASQFVLAILGPFSIGAMSGLLLGLVWLAVLDRIRHFPFSHMLTLSILFLLYALVESTGAVGAGPLAALFFGIVIGNSKNFSVMLKFKKIFEVSPQMKMFQDEITFFIRSFFFVLLGMLLVGANIEIIVLSILVSLLLIVARILTAEIGMVRLRAPNIEKHFIRVMMPRGLAAAVLAQIASRSLPGAYFFDDVVFVVIFITVMYSAVFTMFLSRKIETKEELNQLKNKRKKTRKKVRK